MMKPGCKNSDIAAVLEKIGEAYDVRVVRHPLNSRVVDVLL